MVTIIGLMKTAVFNMDKWIQMYRSHLFFTCPDTVYLPYVNVNVKTCIRSLYNILSYAIVIGHSLMSY